MSDLFESKARAINLTGAPRSLRLAARAHTDTKACIYTRACYTPVHISFEYAYTQLDTRRVIHAKSVC